jgi:hypothetical protein
VCHGVLWKQGCLHTYLENNQPPKDGQVFIIPVNDWLLLPRLDLVLTIK